jgi:hypothetical protein
MGQYIVLNFEDKITDTQKGAADSTIIGLKSRYEVRRNRKGLTSVFLSKNTVTELRCVDAGPPIKFSEDAKHLAAIGSACSTAEKVYLVMHGDPRTTNICYTNAVPATAGVVPLATATQMADFLAKVLWNRKKETRLALIMCYGARCKNYLSAEVNHQGMISPEDLATSFAYRLFYHLFRDHGTLIRLSAVTGKISHDSQTGNAMVEVEEMIDLNMEFSEANSAKLASMKQAVGAPKPVHEQDAAYKANYAAWSAGSEGAALMQRVKKAQTDRKNVLDSLPQEKRSGTMHKYGKIEYRTKGSKLAIASKYGDPGSGLKAGTVLYSGDLLTPA